MSYANCGYAVAGLNNFCYGRAIRFRTKLKPGPR
jgi:hypothetical protein